MKVALVALLLSIALPARAETEPDKGDFLTSGARASVAGVRATTSLTTGGDAAGTGGSVLFGSRTEAYAFEDALTVHRLQYGSIGGGSAGFEGELGGTLSGGFRLRTVPDRGFFLRGGIGGYIGGNKLFYASSLDFPRAELGYQISTRTVLFELAGTGAAELFGHFSARDLGRELGVAPALGGFLALHRAPLRLELSFVRVLARVETASRAVDTARGVACSFARRLALCADVRLVRGDLVAPHGGVFTGVTDVSAGFLVGVSTTSF
jgi:hypothetical protein